MWRRGHAGACRWVFLLVGCGKVGHDRPVAGVQDIVDGTGEILLATEQTVRLPDELLNLDRDRSFPPGSGCTTQA